MNFVISLKLNGTPVVVHMQPGLCEGHGMLNICFSKEHVSEVLHTAEDGTDDLVRLGKALPEKSIEHPVHFAHQTAELFWPAILELAKDVGIAETFSDCPELIWVRDPVAAGDCGDLVWLGPDGTYRVAEAYTKALARDAARGFDNWMGGERLSRLLARIDGWPIVTDSSHLSMPITSGLAAELVSKALFLRKLQETAAAASA